MKIYTDASKLPLAESVAALPSFGGKNPIQDRSGICPLKIAND